MALVCGLLRESLHWFAAMTAIRLNAACGRVSFKALQQPLSWQPHRLSSRCSLPVGTTTPCEVGKHLLMEAVHSQQACLGLRRPALGCLGLRQGFPKPTIEEGFGAEEARHQEVKQRPKLKNGVLDRGSSEDQAVPGSYLFACLPTAFHQVSAL